MRDTVRGGGARREWCRYRGEHEHARRVSSRLVLPRVHQVHQRGQCAQLQNLQRHPFLLLRERDRERESETVRAPKDEVQG